MSRDSSHFFDLDDSLRRDLLPEGNRRLSEPDPRGEPGDETPLSADKVDAVHGDTDISGGDMEPQQPNINPNDTDTSDDGPMELGQIIRRARERRGLKQSDLAHRIGVKQSAISQWESGKATPELANRINLSGVLGIPLNDLFPETAGLPQHALDDPLIRQTVQYMLEMTIEQRRAFHLFARHVWESRDRNR